ncbi:S41 family peptidase [Massilia cellulosiltytica]|nr:S41 family peptidase [Telluria cellulosilytica]
MNRNLLRAAVCALSFAAATAAGAVETMPLAQARAVADQAIGLVESKGLYPRRQEEYAQAKQDLLAAVDGKTADVDRNDLYARIRKVVGTLDTGGHSFLFPPQAPGQSALPQPAGPRVAPFQLVATSRGTVLRWVDRDGKAIPVVDRTGLAGMAARDVGERANPFSSFAAGPLAVLVGAKTASAGEMLLVALMGEERVRTFGQASYGMSTANKVYWLPDGAMLLLTEMRYALADGPVFRGGIAPMQPAPKGEPVEASLRTAAEWAAANSPRCVPE